MLLARPALVAAASIALAAPVARGDECAPGDALAVDGLGTPADELARLADLAPGVLTSSSGLIRRGGASARAMCADGPGTPWDLPLRAPPDGGALDVVTPRLVTAWRNLSPGGANDGVLWQGRGAASVLSGGVTARLGILTAQLAPAVTWSDNASFRIAPTGQGGALAWGDPWHPTTLDLPQRFGAEPFARASLGQSYLQLEVGQLQLGVSTENRWLGPGVRNSLLLSNAAEGFPHAYAGTARPLDVGIGRLELLVLWGRLSRSGYFADQGHPAFTALAFAYEPRWIPGLFIGAGRAYVESWRALREDLFLSILEPPVKGWLPDGDNSDDNQLVSAWARWVNPASGLEIYGEWALEDFAAPAKLVRQPERTGAWTLGLTKLFASGGRWVRFSAETTTTRSTLPPGHGDHFYDHGSNLGYTHEGQPLGAWIGTGADSQYVALDVLTPSGRIGGYLERVRRNGDVFWEQIAGPPPDDGQDVELVAAVRQVRFAGRLELSWEAGVGYRWNRSFLRDEPVFRAEIGLAMRR